MKNYDIVGLETPCLDLNVNLEQLPEPNGGSEISDMAWQGGGKVSTGMAAAARLGASCAMTGSLGDDIFGRFCYADFQYHGINVENMKVRKGCSTHFSLVLSDKKTGTRTVLFRTGQAAPLSEEELDLKMLGNAKYFFISEPSPLTKRAAEYVREKGGRVFMDADYFSDGLQEMIPLVNIFIGSEFVFDSLFPGQRNKEPDSVSAQCEQIRKLGPEAVVFTFGEKGCAGCGREGFFHVPAFPVEAVDTVGAGDVFHGAFLAALLQGKNLKECAVYASGASAVKCTRIGGRAGIPDEKTLEEFLRTGRIDYGEIDKRSERYRKGLEYV